MELTLDTKGKKVAKGSGRSTSLPPIKTEWVKDMSTTNMFTDKVSVTQERRPRGLDIGNYSGGLVRANSGSEDPSVLVGEGVHPDLVVPPVRGRVC